MKKNRHERAKQRLKDSVYSAINGGADPKDNSWKSYNQLIGKDYTIEMGWRLFRTQVIPPDAPMTQVGEMRKAYMAGFTECFKVMNDYAGELPESEAVRFLDRLYHESTAIVDKMLADWKNGAQPCQ